MCRAKADPWALSWGLWCQAALRFDRQGVPCGLGGDGRVRLLRGTGFRFPAWHLPGVKVVAALHGAPGTVRRYYGGYGPSGSLGDEPADERGGGVIPAPPRTACAACSGFERPQHANGAAGHGRASHARTGSAAGSPGGGHIGKLQSLSDRDDWGVNRPERQVIVGAHQLSHAEQVCVRGGGLEARAQAADLACL